MICPKCGLNDQQKVLSTRRNHNQYVLRRRECVCGHRFSSVEIIELNETTMRKLEQIMAKNSTPRAFQKIVHDMYRYVFDHHRWLEEKKGGIL